MGGEPAFGAGLVFRRSQQRGRGVSKARHVAGDARLDDAESQRKKSPHLGRRPSTLPGARQCRRQTVRFAGGIRRVLSLEASKYSEAMSGAEGRVTAENS